MSETKVAFNRAAPGAKSPHRGPQAARLVAGDYVGQQASVAAQAIRRMDLRPGLERSFDDDAPVGVVLGQDPAPGESVVRGGMVTLYVAAPSAGAQGKPPSAPDDEITAPVVIPAAAPLGAPASSDAPAPRRRSRKPGLAEFAAQEPDVVPAPQPLLRREEDPDEELLANTNAVFSGRTAELPAWHRPYSRRIEWRLGLGTRRRLLKSVAIVLAVVASAVVLERLAVAPHARPAAVPHFNGQELGTAVPVLHRSAARPMTARASRRRAHAAAVRTERRGAAAAQRVARAPAPQVGSGPAAAVEVPARAPASSIPAQTQEQSGGGLFSP
jgi:hypothetical protein